MLKIIMEKMNNKKNNYYTLYTLSIIIFLLSFNFVLSDDSTSIIDTKTLTNIVRYSLADIGTAYSTLTTTPLGNLICSESYYGSSTTKYYYGLKPNGRPLFMKDGKETEFSSTDSDRERNEGNIYGIQLSSASSEDTEYVFAIGNNNAYAELYDFSLSDPVVSKIDGKQFFSSNYNSYKYGTIFKLKTGNIYILSLIIQLYDQNKYFHVFKLSFSNNNLYSSPIVTKWTALSKALSFCSCYEDDNNYIICFYIDNNGVYTYYKCL